MKNLTQFIVGMKYSMSKESQEIGQTAEEGKDLIKLEV